jgi:nucleoside-diphosphate-sugar epimerase
MHVFVTGGTGHIGSYIIPELIAAGHEVTGLARSDTAAAAISALGAKVRHGGLEDLDGLKEAAADSDGVIHVGARLDLLQSGGMDAVAAAELSVMLAYGEALAGTGKSLVAAGIISSPGNLGRPVTEEDPALPVGDEHKGTIRVRNIVESAVIGLGERGVQSSVVRIANIAHSTTDRAGFVPILIALAKEKGFAGYPGDGANLWTAVHARDVASLFRLALEKGPAGKCWHAVGDGGIPLREIAEAIGSRLGLPAASIPRDELMVPAYFGILANIVTQSYTASNLITRRTLGWEPAQPGLLADMDNAHYFPASSSVRDAHDVPELSTEKIAQVVRSYIELAGHESGAGHGSADEVAALFADNAIFGPAGGDVQRGNEAIRSAYHSIWDGREQRVDLVSLNVSGAEAAVHVQVVSSGQRVDVIDVMTFDEDAKIASLRTYFGPSNVVTL